jgi:hypothetical protein
VLFYLRVAVFIYYSVNSAHVLFLIIKLLFILSINSKEIKYCVIVYVVLLSFLFAILSIVGYYITIIDFVLAPIYFWIILIFAFKIRNKYYPKGHKLHKYFIPGLIVKILGGLAICFIYVFYFRNGDTLYYFEVSKIIRSSFTNNFSTWFRLITHNVDPDNLTDSYYFSQITEQSYHLNNYVVSVVGSIVGMFCFGSFLCSAIIMATIAYTGLWALFVTFTKLYPRLIKQSAIAALFIPGVAVWGSGLFKDTICMFALGWIFFLFFKINRLRHFKITTIAFFLFLCYAVFIVKVYIIAALFPILLLRLVLKITFKHKNLIHKIFFILFIFFTVFKYYSVFAKELSDNIADTLLDNFTQTVSNFSNANLRVSQEENGSGYNLGELDGSVRDLLSKIPAAINVTFYRPYLWEAGKSITLLASLEALFLLVFSCYVILQARLKVFIYILKDANLLTFLLFSLILGYLIGLTSSNFGTLSRFKIPCMPFFLMSLFIIQYNYKTNRSKKLKDVELTSKVTL